MGIRSIVLIVACIIVISCKKETTTTTIITKAPEAVVIPPTTLTLAAANNLAKLPLKCIQQEYPNKLGQVLGSGEDLKAPKELHPAFYGCFDWHSAVHSHWSLVKLLKEFPQLEQTATIRTLLATNMSSENIQAEISYFNTRHNSTFERTYGWAWLLKLAEELHTWDDPLAKELSQNLQPLTELIVSKYLNFLPKLNYPIRVGEHTNTAFGLAFAWDYANTLNHAELKSLIEQRAKDFYANDTNCPLSWEPSGFDFLSPCLEEAELMARILSKQEFNQWFNNFLPQLNDANATIATGKVSDRTDGKLVHLDGVNFSRAWALLTIAQKTEAHPHLQQIAYEHINYSLPHLVQDSYEGGHWLGSFAIYALFVDK